jgi:anti-sigma B factor antagonist
MWSGRLGRTPAATYVLSKGGYAVSTTAERRSMEVEATQMQSVPVFSITGEIDHSNAATLSEAVEIPLTRGESVILLDLTGVDYIDSGGVSVLLSTVRRLRNRGWLGVINPNSNVRRLLEIVGLTVDHGFRVFSDQDEAGKAVEAHDTSAGESA